MAARARTLVAASSIQKRVEHRRTRGKSGERERKENGAVENGSEQERHERLERRNIFRRSHKRDQ